MLQERRVERLMGRGIMEALQRSSTTMQETNIIPQAATIR